MNNIKFDQLSDWLDYWLCTSRLPYKHQVILERYYKSFVINFGPYLRKHYNSQILEAENFIKKNQGCRVLEIGCGCGTESLWLGMNGARVIGIDLQRDRLEVARSRLDHLCREIKIDCDVQFHELSVFDALNLGKFDLIWMEQAYHHVEPREEFLRLLTDLVKPGGTVIISESNAFNPLLQFQYFMQRGFETIKEYTDKNGNSHTYGNERITTAARLCKDLEQVDFNIRSVRHYRVFPNYRWADRLDFIEKYIPASTILPPLLHIFFIVIPHKRELIFHVGLILL